MRGSTASYVDEQLAAEVQVGLAPVRSMAKRSVLSTLTS